MNNDTRDIISALPKLLANPLLANILGVFSVPLSVMYTSTKIVSTGKYDFIIHGVLGVLCLVYSALMALLFVKAAKKDKEKLPNKPGG